MVRREDPESGTAAHAPEDGDPVIELTEIVEDRPGEASAESSLRAADGGAADGDGGENDVIELTEVADGSAPPAPDLKLSEEQIQSALARVIRELYAEKIEKLLYDAVKQTVTREIERIKSILLDKALGTESLFFQRQLVAADAQGRGD